MRSRFAHPARGRWTPVLVLALATAPSALPLLAAPVALAQTPPAFTDVSAPPVNDPGTGEGVSWVDYDRDGDLDLTLSNEGQTLKLFRNDGGGVFVDASPAPFTVRGIYTGIAWADFDNDGDLDLYAAEAERPHHLFRNNGDGTFTDVAAPVLDVTNHTHGVSWADYDLDGDVDLFLANAPWTNGTLGTSLLFRNNGDGTFTDVTTPTLADNQYGRGTTWGDYDNDGDPDLFLATFGTDRLWRNDNGTFVDVATPPVNNLNHGGGCEFGDYDNDGDLDLYVGNAFSGPGRLYRNEGGGAWTDASAGGALQAGRCIGVTWGDWDNDGDLDLYIAKFGDPNALLRNEGGGVFVNVTTPTLADSLGQGVGTEFGDYDGDGDLDLFVANNSGPDKLFRNDLASGRHWLQLDLVGTLSNRSAIGARVTVVTLGLLQIREVSGGGGYNSQPTMRQHIGLGSATTVDRIHIRWPSGMIEETTMVAVDQRITLVEGTLPAAVGDDRGPLAALRLTAAPNPAFTATRLEYDLPRAGRVSLVILDVTGRVVRVLERGAAREGSRHRATWDGADAHGRRVSPGVYVAQLTTEDRSSRVRLVRY